MKKQNIYLSTFESLASFLKKLSEEEVSKFESGEATIKFQLIFKDVSNKKGADIDATEIIEHLYKMSTREEAQEYLNKVEQSRSNFEIILRKLDYPFTKKDKVDKLREKIIEATVGFRLRSKAIQGNISL